MSSADVEAITAPDTFRGRAGRILQLALPIIGGMVSQNLLNLVDTAMVGRLGSPALGAVGFGGMVNWLAGAFFIGMGSGVQAIAARRIGEGSPRGAIEAVHGALVVVLLVVLPYALLVSTQTERIYGWLSNDPDVVRLGAPYLRVRLWSLVFIVCNFTFRGYWNGIGRSTVYLRTILVIHAVNIFLNWVLIFGNLGFEPMGVTGAGVASAIAVAVGTMTYIALAMRYSRQHGFLSRKPSPPRDGVAAEAVTALRETIRGVMRLSVPAGLQNVFLSAGFVALYRIAQAMGTTELAASNVLINLSLVCILPAIGFGLAAATLVGQSLGRGRPEEARRWGWTTVAIGCASMLVLGIAVAAPARAWLSLLMKDPKAIAIAVTPLVLLGLLQPLDGIGMVLSQALIGAGYVRVVTLWSVGLQWVLFLPAAYVACVRMNGTLLTLWIILGVWRGLFSGVMALAFARGAWARTKV